MESVFSVPFRDSISTAEKIKVMAVSVRVESIVSKSIGRLLGFTSLDETRSFGNKSTSLSFNAKLNLFLDIQGITKEQANILIKFSEIRNKFAHVEGIETIYDCLQICDPALKKFLEKKYSSKVNEYVYNVEGCYGMFLAFLEDVEDVCSKIFQAMIDKILKDEESYIGSKKHLILKDTILDRSILTEEQQEVVKHIVRIYLQRVKDYDFESGAPPII